MSSPIKVFATSGSDVLAAEVARELAERLAEDFYPQVVALGKAEVSKFSNENLEVQVDNVRDHTVLVIHTMAPPVNENLIELFALLDSINNSHPAKVFVVFPYMPYCRSDRKNRPRISVMGQRIPEILNKVLGVHRVMLIEPHDPHIKQYFVPTADEVPGAPLLVEHIRRHHLTKYRPEECTIVFADAGAAKRYEEVPQALGLDQAYIHKMRVDNTESPTVKGVTGNVKDRHCFIVDDEILTGNTLLKDAEILKEKGAATVTMFAVHGVLADKKLPVKDLIAKLTESSIDEIVVTDTIPVAQKCALGKGKITVVPVAPLLGEACRRLILGESLSELHRINSMEELDLGI